MATSTGRAAVVNPGPIDFAALTVLLFVAVASAGVRSLRNASRRDRSLAGWMVMALVAILGLRFALVTPSFVHAHLHGAGLVEATLAFPEPSTYRASYGQFGFFLLGAVASVFGRRFEVLAATNQVIAVAALGMAAVVAWRVLGSRFAAWVVLAAGALHPAILRVAASEDVHSLAVLLGLIALWGMDVFVTERRYSALVAATVGLVLMSHTRQTLYALVPCAYVLAFAGGGRALFRDRAWVGSALVVAAALALRVAGTLGETSERTSLIVMGILITAPKALFDIVVHHPLLDVVRFGPIVPVLLVVGVVSCWRQRGTCRALAAIFIGFFVLTLPFGFRTPGVEFSFRLPTIMLGLIMTARGAVVALGRVRAHVTGERWARFAGSATLCALPLTAAILPGARELHHASADFQEYRFVRDVAPTLPSGSWVRLPRSNARPTYKPPVGLARRAGVSLDFVDGHDGPTGGSIVFLAGLECWAWSLGEVIGAADVNPADVSREIIERWTPVLFGNVPPEGVPTTMRPECEALLRDAEPFGPEGSITDPRHDVPFVVYGVPRIPLRFFRLRALPGTSPL